MSAIFPGEQSAKMLAKLYLPGMANWIGCNRRRPSAAMRALFQPVIPTV